MYLKKYNLKNKVALVSGAGKGLGRACALALAEAGANLIIISRTQKDLDQVARNNVIIAPSTVNQNNNSTPLHLAENTFKDDQVNFHST